MNWKNYFSKATSFPSLPCWLPWWSTFHSGYSQNIIPVEFDFLRDSKPWGKVSNRLQHTGIKNFCYSQASSNLYKILAQGDALPTSQDPHGVVLHVWLVSSQLDPHPLLEEPCLPWTRRAPPLHHLHPHLLLPPHQLLLDVPRGLLPFPTGNPPFLWERHWSFTCQVQFPSSFVSINYKYSKNL